VLTYVVRLQHPRQLFQADPVDPMSRLYTEFTAVPALDTVRDLVLASPTGHRGVRLVIELPSACVTPGLQEELTEAIARYVAVANTLDSDIRAADGPIVRRLLVLSVAAFFLVQTCAIWVRNLGERTGIDPVQALGEGLTVASWVLLWVPVQQLTVEQWRSHLQARRVRALRHPEIVVVPAPAADEHRGPG